MCAKASTRQQIHDITLKHSTIGDQCLLHPQGSREALQPGTLTDQKTFVCSWRALFCPLGHTPACDRYDQGGFGATKEDSEMKSMLCSFFLAFLCLLLEGLKYFMNQIGLVWLRAPFFLQLSCPCRRTQTNETCVAVLLSV
eukprot:262081-Pelagomonas_calceolata.AAC.1